VEEAPAGCRGFFLLLPGDLEIDGEIRGSFTAFRMTTKSKQQEQKQKQKQNQNQNTGSFAAFEMETRGEGWLVVLWYQLVSG
jgi:hypothetical protein